MAPPWGSHVLHMLKQGKHEKTSLSESCDILYEASLSGPLPCLFKYGPRAKYGPAAVVNCFT